MLPVGGNHSLITAMYLSVDLYAIQETIRYDTEKAQPALAEVTYKAVVKLQVIRVQIRVASRLSHLFHHSDHAEFSV